MSNDTFRTTRKFSTSRKPYLKGHRLNGSIVVSGASLLTSIADFIENNQSDMLTLEMQDVFFCRPLIIESENFELEVDVEWDKRRGSVVIKNAGQVCAVCSRIVDGALSDSILDENNPATSFSSKFYTPDVIQKSVNTDDFYAFMHRRGYEYADVFQAVDEIRLIVEQHNDNDADTMTYGLCKIDNVNNIDAIIDGTVQAMVYAILHESQMIVPFSIGKSQLFRSRRQTLTNIYGFFRVCVAKHTGDCFIKCNGEELFFAEAVYFRPIEKLLTTKNLLQNENISCKNPTEYEPRYGIRAISCRLPGSVNSPADFWQLLINGRVTDQRIPAKRIPTRNRLLRTGHVEGGNFIEQRVQDFDAAFFGISKAEAEAMDPQQRILLECIYECMENAHLKTLSGSVGFFVGLMGTEYSDIVEAASRRDMLAMLGSSMSIVAGRLNHYFDGFGPAVCVDTACSSSLTCIDLAIQSIKAGRCKKAVVAGVNLILTEKSLQQRANGKMLSWDGVCRTFDANATGYGRADGCVAIIIEQVNDDTMYEAIIESINLNHDGRSTALMAPNPNSQTKLISECVSKLSSDKKILFWECHGTGTPLGDPIEFTALNNALKTHREKSNSRVYISSAKASIGHCEAASGLVGVLKAILQLKNAYVPRLPRFCVLNNQIRLCQKSSDNDFMLKIPICGVELDQQGFCGVSSFGVSGTNACVILSTSKNCQQNDEIIGRNHLAILPLSGKSIKSLNTNLCRCLDTLKFQAKQPLLSSHLRYCATYSVGKIHHKHRICIILQQKDGLVFPEVIRKIPDKAINFKFISGLWSSFQFDLFCRIPYYRYIFTRTLALSGISLMEALQPHNANILRVTDVLAKFQLLTDWGITTQIFIDLPERSKRFQFAVIFQKFVAKQSIENFMECVKLANCSGKDKDEENFEHIANSIGPDCEFNLDSIYSFQQLVAVAYVNGYALNWDMIYPQSSSTVQLPNYAFDRQSYWINKLPKIIAHGLMGNTIENTEDYVVFENLVSTKRLPFLNQVCHSSVRLFPLGATLEMIIAAAYTSIDIKSDEGIRITNIALHQLSNLQERDFWLNTTVNKRFFKLEMLIDDEKILFCSANFCNVKNLRKEKWPLPLLNQQIDENQFKQQIYKNSRIDYRDFDRVDVFLDEDCNIVKIATEKNPLAGDDFIINPVLLETFAQILLNYGVIKEYDVIVQRIKMIEVFKKINKFCFINIDDNVIESFDENQDLAMRVVLDLSVTNAESNILSQPITRRQNYSDSKDIEADAKSEPLKYDEVVRRIISALEDSVALESPLDNDAIHTGFVDIGLDSLSLVGFLNKLNQEYFSSINISSTDLFSNPTVASLAAFIETKKTESSVQKKSTHKDFKTEIKPKEIRSSENDLSGKVLTNTSDVLEEVHAYNLVPFRERFSALTKFQILFAKSNRDIYVVKLLIDDAIVETSDVVSFNDLNIFCQLLTIITRTYNKTSDFAELQLKFFDESIPITDAAKLILSLVKALIHSVNLPRLQLCVKYSDISSVLDGMARGFLKSLAAEKPDKFIFRFEEKMEKIKSLHVALPHPAPCGAWLITGGTSGIGFEMAEYLALHYNINFIGLIGRRPIQEKSLITRLERIQRFCNVKYLQADVSDYSALEQSFNLFAVHASNLEGVIHSAGCTRDSRIELMSANAFDEVLRPKCIGLMNLEKCLKKFNYTPTFFIVNSSISSTMGNSAQCNYSSANAWMDERIRQRRRHNLSGTSIQWGNWLETGMAARLGVNAQLYNAGFHGLRAVEAMKYFRYVLESNPETIVVANINWNVLLDKRKELRVLWNDIENECLDEYKHENNSQQSYNTTLTGQYDKSKLEKKNYDNMDTTNIETMEEVKCRLTRLIQNYLGGIDDQNSCTVSDDVGFIELGLDSLKLYLFAVDLQTQFSAINPQFSLTVIDLFQNPTVDKLAKHILIKIKSKKEKIAKPEDRMNVRYSGNVIVSNKNFELISQHRVEGEIIVPAAFQIRLFENLIARSYARNLDHVFINGIVFKRPIDLKNIGYMSLLSHRKDAEVAISLTSSTSTIEIFSNCEFHFDSVTDEGENANIFAKKVYHELRNSNCLRNLDENEFYTGMKEHGIDYGEPFQMLSNINIASNFVEADFSHGVSSTYAEESESDWRLYDAALQALSAIVYNPADVSYYVPIQISSFWRINKKTANANMYPNVKMKIIGHIHQREENFLVGTVAFVSENFTWLIMKDVTAVRRQCTNATIIKTRKNAVSDEDDIRQWTKFFLKQSTDLKSDQQKNISVKYEKTHNNNITEDLLKGQNNRRKSEIAVIGWSSVPMDVGVEEFDAEFFNINAKEAPFVDPQQRLLLEAVVGAMECAGLPRLPAKTAVFIGSSSSDFAQRAYSELSANGYLATGTNNSVLSGRVAHFIGATAETETIDTACSSFSVALARACDALHLQRCKYAIVGAVNIPMNEKTTDVLRHLGVLSPNNRCASFDVDADGYLRGSAVGAVIIKRVDFPTEKTQIRITGWSVGHAGHDSASITASSTTAQCRIMCEVLQKANLAEVDLVECHGSATPLGDPIEAASILHTFKSAKKIMLSSSKSLFGHCEAAAGFISFIEVLNVMKDNNLKSFNHFKLLNPKIRVMSGSEKFLFPLVNMEVKIQSALINNFAFNGTNSAIVLASNSSRGNNNAQISTPMSTLLVMSAKSRRSLEGIWIQVQRYLCDNSYRQLRAAQVLCDVFLRKRYHYRPHRMACVVEMGPHNNVKLHEIIDKIQANTPLNLMLATTNINEGAAVVLLNDLMENHGGFRNFFRNYNADFSTFFKYKYILNLIVAEFFAACINNNTVIVTFNDATMKKYFDAIGSRNMQKTNHCTTTEISHMVVDFSEIFCLDKRPSFVLNDIFGRLFLAHVPFDVSIFCPETNDDHFSSDLNIPGYVFDRKRFWPFMDSPHKDSTNSTKKLKKFVVNEKPFKSNSFRFEPHSHPTNLQLVHKRQSHTEKRTSAFNQQNQYRPNAINIYCRVFELYSNEDQSVLDHNKRRLQPMNICVVNLTYKKLPPARQESENDECILKDIRSGNVAGILVVFDETDDDESIIHNFWRLGRLIAAFDHSKESRFLVVAESQKSATGRCDIVAFLRSAAAEYARLVYRVISTNKDVNETCTREFVDEQFRSMCRPCDSAHLQLHNDGNIFIERLKPINSANTIDLEKLNNNISNSLGKILITGGSGGLAQELIHCLGATSIISVSRRKYKRVKHYIADCTDLNALSEIFRNEAHITTVFHCAGVVQNKCLENFDVNDFRHVFAPKVTATRNLLALCAKYNVRNFVAISSAAGTLGFAGQANYATANMLMERICATALASTRTCTYALGPISDVGMLASASISSIRRQITDSGWKFIHSTDIIQEIMKNLIDNDSITSVMIFNGDWASIREQQPHLHKFLQNVKTFDGDQNAQTNRHASFSLSNGMIDSSHRVMSRRQLRKRVWRPKIRIRDEIRQMKKQNSSQCFQPKQNDMHTRSTKNNQQSISKLKICDELEKLVRKVSGITEPQRDVGLMSIGVDSIMIEEIRAEAARLFSVTITIAEMYAHVTINELASLIASKPTIRIGFTKDEELSKMFLDIQNKCNVELSSKVEDEKSINICRNRESVILENLVIPSELDEDDIAIIAMSGTFSGARTVDELWENLLVGKESMSNTTDFKQYADNLDDKYKDDENQEENREKFVPLSGFVPDTDAFDASPFPLSDEDARTLDPQVRCAIIHAYKALEQSGYLVQRTELRVGCYIGAEPSNFPHSALSNTSRGSLIDMFARNQKDFCALLISYLLNLRGPSAAVYTACSTAMVAIRQAADLLTRGDADLCLAGAVHLISIDDLGHDYLPGMVLAPRAQCRPFGAHRDGGILRGSGCGVVVLKMARAAYRDADNILGVIKSCVLNNDGTSAKSNFMAPSLNGQSAVMREALAVAEKKGISSADIAYLECHATGTFVGDSIELQAISDVFANVAGVLPRRQPLLLGSIKANIGHSFAASGFASLAKCLKILDTGTVPFQLGDVRSLLDKENDAICVPWKTQRDIFMANRPRCVGINSFGIGGTNASAILMAAPSKLAPMARQFAKLDSTPLIDGSYTILPVSAASRRSCVLACHAIANYLSQLADKIDVNDVDNLKIKALKRIGYTLQFCRERYRWRAAVVSHSLRDAAKKLSHMTEIDVICVPSNQSLNGTNLAAYFSPQGVQYPNMLRAELQNSTWLRTCLDSLAADFDNDHKALIRILSTDEINNARYTQCALFALCRAASNFISEALNFRPSVLFGHSMGEYTALAEAGVLSDAHCMQLLRVRGQLISETKPAKMLVVYEDVTDLISGATGIEESARLSERIRVLVGPPSEIDTFCRTLKAMGREFRLLKTEHGFHSAFLDSILPKFARSVKKIIGDTEFGAPQQRVISNVDGTFLDVQRLSIDYLSTHLRQPVRLDLSIDKVIEIRPAVCAILEIGPPGMLDNLVQQKLVSNIKNVSHDKISSQQQIQVLPVMQSRWAGMKDNELDAPLFESIARLWTIGFDVDFGRICGREYGIDHTLPGYQFDLRILETPTRVFQQSSSCNVPAIYQQRLKFTADFSLVETKLIPNSLWERTLLVTNSERVTRETIENSQTEAKPFATIRLKFGEANLISKLANNVFELSADYFDQLAELGIERDTIDLVVYYYDNEENVRDTFNKSLIEANVAMSFTSLREIVKKISIQLTSSARIYCMTGSSENSTGWSSLYAPMAFAALSALRHEVLNICNFALIEGVTYNNIDVFLAQFEQLSHNSLKNADFEWFKIKNNILMQIYYERDAVYAPLHLNSDNILQSAECEYALLLGGTGDVGMAYAQTIRQLWPRMRLIFVSRRATISAERLSAKFCDLMFIDTDISDAEQVKQLFCRCLQFGRCRFIVHCAGIPPKERSFNTSNGSFNHLHANNRLFDAKVYGALNILSEIVQTGMKIDALVLNSSLTAINGLPGAAEYAAANLFLDAIATVSTSIAPSLRVLSVQWPAWRGSKMFCSSKLSSDASVRDFSISKICARHFIAEVLNNEQWCGVVAVSALNPIDIRRHFYSKNNAKTPEQNHNFNNESKQDSKQIKIEDLQLTLRDLWLSSLPKSHDCDILNDIGDFFSLGGDSLSAVQLAWRVERAVGVHISPDWLFQHAEFSSFYQKVANAMVESKRDMEAEALNVPCVQNWTYDKAIPLSLPQEQMWLLWRLNRELMPHSGLYNIVFRIDLHGDELDLRAVEYALRRLNAVQTSLRTRFVGDATYSTLRQEVLSLTESFHALCWQNIANCKDREICIEECAYDFDLAIGSPMRVRGCYDGDVCSIYINHHHIITDGWSVSVFARQFSVFYRSAVIGNIPTNNLLELGISYSDYATWNRHKFENAINGKLKDLVERLKKLPPGGTEIKARITQYQSLSTDNDCFDSVEINLMANVKEALDKFCARAKTTRYIALLSAFLRAVDIWRIDAASQIESPTPLVIGSAVAGRSAPQLNDLIGYFLNNIVIAVEAHGCADVALWNTNAQDVVAYVKRCVDEANAYADVPFHRAVALMQTHRSSASATEHNPVFQIFFNYRHDLDFPNTDFGEGVHASITQISRNRVFPLSCTVDEIWDGTTGEHVRLTLDYSRAQLDANHAQSFLQDVVAQLQNLFAANSANDWSHYADVAENTPSPTRISLASALYAQVHLTPHNAAIHRVFGDGQAMTVSYAQLWTCVETQSRWLRQHYFCALGAPLNGSRDIIVPLVFSDNNAVVIWILTLLNCGVAYAIIDAQFPLTRIITLLETLSCQFVLTDSDNIVSNLHTNYRTCLIHTKKINQETNAFLNCSEVFHDRTIREKIIEKNIDTQHYHNSNKEDYNLSKHLKKLSHETFDQKLVYQSKISTAQNQGCDLAYVCFTSGTTGIPKGVCVEQRNVLAFVIAATRRLRVDSTSRIAHSVNCAFDVSVFNIFGAFLNGACLIQLDSLMNFVAPPSYLAPKASLNHQTPFSHFFLNSAIFNSLNDAELRRVINSATNLIVGGETPNSSPLRVCMKYATNSITQIYGPTETTVWSTVQHITTSPCIDGTLIGSIQTNEYAILLHASDARIPLTKNSLAVGELCIGGAGVARGYLEKHLSPSDAFVILPGVGPVYRTGDLVRRVANAPSAGYRFLGRNDSRLKIGGVRIDPTEVSEACSREWQRIIGGEELGSLYVTSEINDVGGSAETELVVYISTNTTSEVLNDRSRSARLVDYIDIAQIVALRRALSNALPQNAVPSSFVFVDHLPINRVGKVDRVALNALYNEWRAKNIAADKTNDFNKSAQCDRDTERVTARLVRVWQKVLAAVVMSDQDLTHDANFFTLGGHSLLLLTLKRCICEEFRELNENDELKLDELFRYATLGEQVRLISQRINAKSTELTSDMSVISMLRAPTAASAEPAIDVYCIHAIGGTLYPYYSILHVMPANWRVFGINFDDRMRVASLVELAQFYAYQILINHPHRLRRFMLLGHSLGGILAYEVAIIVNKTLGVSRFIPFIVAIDSWTIGTATLDLDVVQAYLIKQFRLMPNRARLLKGAMRLAWLLKTHTFQSADIGVRLFKATRFSDHSLRHCIRDVESSSALGTVSDNGWSTLTNSLEIFLCDGDHDTILRAEALTPHSDTLARFGRELNVMN